MGNEELLIWHIALLGRVSWVVPGQDAGSLLPSNIIPHFRKEFQVNRLFFFFLFGSSIYPSSGLFLVQPWYPPNCLLPELSQSRSKGGGGEGEFPETHTLLGNDLFRRLTSPIAILIRWTPIEERMKGLLEDYGIESF